MPHIHISVELQYTDCTETLISNVLLECSVYDKVTNALLLSLSYMRWGYKKKCEIWRFHSGVIEGSVFLLLDAMCLVWLSGYRRFEET